MSLLPLFVYGTLRAHAGHPMHRWLANGGQALGAARVRGTLLMVADYPGLVPAQRAADWVYGEIWQLADPHCLVWLDGYEACGFDDPFPHAYGRRPTQAITAEGGPMRVWAYWWQGNPRERPRIDSGDWLRVPPTREA